MSEELIIEAGKELAKSALKSLAKKAIKKLYTPSKKTLKRRARRQKRQAARQAQREVFKAEQLQKRQQAQVARDTRHPQTLERNVNNALQFAKSKYSGNKYYGIALLTLMQKLMGEDYIPSNNDKNEYFYIDKDYSGKLPELYGHVHFKNIPDDNTDAVQYAEDILDMNWSNPSNYKTWTDQWHTKSYNTSIKKYLPNISIEMRDALRNIMQTSAAWHIIENGGYESSQYFNLFEKVEEAYNNLEDDQFAEIAAMIDREDSYEEIEAKINEYLSQM